MHARIWTQSKTFCYLIRHKNSKKSQKLCVLLSAVMCIIKLFKTLSHKMI